jgi:hypothetical protein
MRTERKPGDGRTIHMVWMSEDQTAMCGERQPRLKIAWVHRHTHPIILQDPLFCAECVKLSQGNPPPAKRRGGKMW